MSPNPILDATRAEIERITKERDEALAEFDRIFEARIAELRAIEEMAERLGVEINAPEESPTYRKTREALERSDREAVKQAVKQAKERAAAKGPTKRWKISSQQLDDARDFARERREFSRPQMMEALKMGIGVADEVLKVLCAGDPPFLVRSGRGRGTKYTLAGDVRSASGQAEAEATSPTAVPRGAGPGVKASSNGDGSTIDGRVIAHLQLNAMGLGELAGALEESEEEVRSALSRQMREGEVRAKRVKGRLVYEAAQ